MYCCKKNYIIVFFIISVLYLNCSSKNIRMDEKYFNKKYKCVVICKENPKCYIDLKSRGLVSLSKGKDTRSDDFLKYMNNMDLRESMKISFINMIKTNSTKFEIIESEDVLDELEETDNYDFLLDDYDIPLIFILKIGNCGVKEKKTLIHYKYYSHISVTNKLIDLSKNNKKIWQATEENYKKISAHMSTSLSNDGKMIYDTFNRNINIVNKDTVDDFFNK